MSDQQLADMAKRTFEDFLQGKSVAEIATFNGILNKGVEELIRQVFIQLAEAEELRSSEIAIASRIAEQAAARRILQMGSSMRGQGSRVMTPWVG